MILDYDYGLEEVSKAASSSNACEKLECSE